MTTIVPSSRRTGERPERYPGLETFYRDVALRTIRTLRLLGFSIHEAEDAVHGVMVDMLDTWAGKKMFADRQRAKYLRMVSLHRAVNARRRDGRVQPLPDEMGSREPDQPVERLIVDATVPDEAVRLIDQLPEQQRWAFVLAYHDYSYPQIAELMQISKSTARSHLAAARKALRPHLDRKGVWK